MFPHNCSTDSISCSKRWARNLIKKYQNKTETRKRRDSVTVTNPIASKIDTLLSLPIHRACCRSAAASVVVSDPLYASSILRQCLHCRCCSLCANLPRPTPPPLSYIPWVCCQSPAASVVVSDPSDVSSIPRPPPTLPLSSLSPWDRLLLLKPPLFLSIS